MVLKLSSLVLYFFVSTYAALTSFLMVSLNASTLSIFMFRSSTRTCAMNSSAFLTSSRTFLLLRATTLSFLNVL